MKFSHYFILAFFVILGFSVSSCISDSMSTSPSDILTFSRDTVNFDTVFTDVGTPTARLIVHNRAKKGINISSIRVKGENTLFQINVDGVSGKTFHDVEIRAQDSIYVFIECFIPESQRSEPFLVEDKLEFITNGVTQEVQLEAYGQNVTRMRGKVLTTDTRLTTERPYVVFDSLVVERGATLRIDPGVKLLFHDGAGMRIRGRIEAVGEPGKMIHMRGDRLDDVLTDVGYDILAGQWKGISIAPESFDNRLEYIDMRSTSEGLAIDSCTDLSRSKLLLRNSWLHNSQGSALKSSYAKVEAYGCCFSEAADAVVSLTGGEHTFIQCTIANNYLFFAISEPLLSLYHCLPDENGVNPQPLMKASFDNCIIYGIAADINETDLSGSQVFLRYTMLKSGGSDDDNFINCYWDCDPMFLTVRDDYYFNYHVKPDSPAIGAGNPSYVNDLTLYDMDGANRLSAGNPTLGAYATPEEDTHKPRHIATRR